MKQASSPPAPRPRRPRLPQVAVLLESSRAAGRALLLGVTRYAQAHGPWSVFWEPGGLEKAWPQLKSRELDGIIMRDVGPVDEVLAARIPVVMVRHSRSEMSGIVTVVTDAESIGRLAAEHLLECGFRSFAYCGLTHSGIELTPWSQHRADSYGRRLGAAGFKPAIFDARQADLTWNEERQLLVDWLNGLQRPVAIMACNDDRGRQLLEACRHARLAVPDEVAVIGADNDELVCGLSNPPLSSVAIGFEQAGYQGAQALSDLMAGMEPAAYRIIAQATHVARRPSTDIIAVGDTHVARALKFIRDNSRQAISVTDVSRAAGVSRRALETRFLRWLCRSVLSEIRRVRGERISSLLADTDLSITEIATQMGFETPQHFARYFRSCRGTTPSEYRRNLKPGA